MTSQLTDGEYCLKTNFEQNDVSLFYVKLTKSADRAINEYLRNPNKFKNEPSILFTKRNEGQISIPIASSHNGKVLKEPLKFEFSVTVDADAEKRSLFECYHYERNKVLKRTGSLKCKLCIHANDDIYETTKNRMAAIEEQQKAKRTRELDWSYATGKKIKVDTKKSVLKSISAETGARNFSQTPSASNSNNSNVNSNVNNSSSGSASASNSVNNVTYNRADASNKSKPNENNKKMSDILLMRKPLKERMLHMLAVKPYSKQELFNAINRVSIQPNDVTRLTNTLTSLAVICDNNMYDLSKEKWTDVHEDWPFYTADERQQVKKRKRLILASATAPSPPLPNNNNNNLPSPTNKRQENGGDHGTCNSSPDYSDSRSKLILPPKYSTNSHYKNCSTNSSSFNKSLPSILGPDVDKPGPPFTRPTANQDQFLPSLVNETAAGSDNSGNSKRRRISHFTTRENSTTNVTPSAIRNTHNPSVARILPTTHVKQVANKTVVNDKESSGFPDKLSSFASVDEQHQPERAAAGVQFGLQTAMTTSSSLPTDESSSNFSTAYSSKSALTVHPMKKENVRICVPDSTQDSLVNGVANDLPTLPNGTATNDTPLYEFNYGKVTSIEQRRKYKEDFNQTYREYKELHNEVDSVRVSFLALGDELKRYPTDSANYKKLESKVYERYNYLKKDSRFKMVKRRFEYLHEKLALIKRRIQEYDDMIVNDST